MRAKRAREANTPTPKLIPALLLDRHGICSKAIEIQGLSPGVRVPVLRPGKGVICVDYRLCDPDLWRDGLPTYRESTRKAGPRGFRWSR